LPTENEMIGKPSDGPALITVTGWLRYVYDR
jgi:hypothetical protein